MDVSPLKEAFRLSGVIDMALGLTIPMRYRPASSTESLQPTTPVESVMPLEIVASRCPCIVRNRNAWGRSESGIDMGKPNISPAGLRLLYSFA